MQAWTSVAQEGEPGRKWEDADPGRMTWVGSLQQVSVQDLWTGCHTDFFYAHISVGMYKSSSGCLLALILFGWASSALLNVNVVWTGLTYVKTDWGVWTCAQFGFICPRPRLTITHTFLLSLPFFSLLLPCGSPSFCQGMHIDWISAKLGWIWDADTVKTYVISLMSTHTHAHT